MLLLLTLPRLCVIFRICALEAPRNFAMFMKRHRPMLRTSLMTLTAYEPSEPEESSRQ